MLAATYSDDSGAAWSLGGRRRHLRSNSEGKPGTTSVLALKCPTADALVLRVREQPLLPLAARRPRERVGLGWKFREAHPWSRAAISTKERPHTTGVKL